MRPMKLLTAMFLVLCACGGGGAKKETASGKGKKKGAEVTKVDDDGGEEGAEGGEGSEGRDGGDEGEEGGGKKGKKSAGAKGQKKGGSWGSGQARTCLDDSRLPDGAAVRVAAAMEKDVLRVCHEAGEGDETSRACVGVDPETGRGSRATIKPLAAASGELAAGKLKTEGEKPEVCSSEDQCKPLGKKAAKALAEVQAKEGGSGVVTSDGALLGLSGGGSYQVWNVAKDKPVKLKAPKSVTKEYLASAKLSVIGNEIVATWNPCAGPCTVTRRYDAKGKAVGADLTTEDVPHYYDDARWTILASDLLVFDTKSGKQQHAIKLFPEFPKYTVDGTAYTFGEDIIAPSTSVSLGEGRVALLFQQEPVIAIANLDEGKLVSLYRVPLCNDEDAEKDEEALKGSGDAAAAAGGEAAGEANGEDAGDKPAKPKSKSKSKAKKKSE